VTEPTTPTLEELALREAEMRAKQAELTAYRNDMLLAATNAAVAKFASIRAIVTDHNVAELASKLEACQSQYSEFSNLLNMLSSISQVLKALPIVLDQAEAGAVAKS